MDLNYVKELGPFLQALGRITLSSERNKELNDRVVPGNEFGGVDYNMAGSFLLFRGAPMMNDWIAPYDYYIGGDFI